MVPAIKSFMKLTASQYALPILCTMTVFSSAYALQPPKPFKIPLAVVYHEPGNDTIKEKVCILFDKCNDIWEIYFDKERHVIVKDMNTEEEIFHKPKGQEFLMNSIEAGLISRVCRTLSKTLDLFETDLKKQQWDKCLYLDPYISSFFCGFYHLITIVKSSRKALPSITCPSDTMYTRSLESPKSVARINTWIGTADHVTKLRIAAKELIFQTKKWQERELDNSKRDPWEDQSGDFVIAYERFIRLYYNIPPRPDMQK
jgi:hypothetical protein